MCFASYPAASAAAASIGNSSTIRFATGSAEGARRFERPAFFGAAWDAGFFAAPRAAGVFFAAPFGFVRFFAAPFFPDAFPAALPGFGDVLPRGFAAFGLREPGFRAGFFDADFFFEGFLAAPFGFCDALPEDFFLGFLSFFFAMSLRFFSVAVSGGVIPF